MGVLAASGVLAACAPPTRESSGDGATGSGTGAQGADAPIGTLTLALPSSLSSLDVGRESGVLNYLVAVLAQESLLSVDPSGKLGPGLASSWKQPDARTYVYTLRRGVTFTDGTPFTADDVVASIDAIRDPKNGSALGYAYAGVDSVKSTGDHEVTIRLKAPDAMFAWTTTGRRTPRQQPCLPHPEQGQHRHGEDTAARHRPLPDHRVRRRRPCPAGTQRRLVGREARRAETEALLRPRQPARGWSR